MKLKRFIVNILFYINLGVAFLLILSYLSIYINPSKFWMPAFLGLAYPYLLIVNLAFLVFWIIRKKKYLFISLIVILIGWKHIGSNVRLPISLKETKSTKGITLISYNVRGVELNNSNHGQHNKKIITDFVQEKNPDFLCMQDYLIRYRRPIIVPEVFQEKYKFENSVIIRASFNNNYGLSILSKYPLISKGEIHFKYSNNFCIYGDYKIGPDTIRIYNAHLQSIKLNNYDLSIMDDLTKLDHNNKIGRAYRILSKIKKAFEKRAVQVEELMDHVINSPYRTIVCGDFNDTPVSYTYQHMTKTLKDSYTEKGIGFGKTYVGKAPSYRIDYIFHDSEFTTLYYEKYKIDASDHLPIMAKIMLQ